MANDQQAVAPQQTPADASQDGGRTDPVPAATPHGKALVRAGIPAVFARFMGSPISIGNALILLVILGTAVVGIILAIGPTRDASQIGINSVDYARGLITLIFTGGTMLIAVLLVLYAITSESPLAKERFTYGKEVLTLLIGVFGTILGFYFGKSDTVPAGPAPTEQSVPAEPRTNQPAPAANDRQAAPANQAADDA